MNSQPIVSVIVSTFKRADSLHRALLSLSRQTYTRLEVIVVDDNADEDMQKIVREIISEFQALLTLVLLQDGQNKGSARARNMGIAVASGEFITFLDDDDEYLPDKVQRQLCALITQHGDYGITDLALYSEDGRLIEYRDRAYLREREPRFLLSCHLKYHMTGTDTLMFKTKYLRAIGGFPPIDVGDEFYLMQNAIMMNGKLAYLPECGVKAYVHTSLNGLSSGQTKIIGENKLFAHKKQFFDDISPADIRYICMRHYAVLMFAETKRKKFLSAMRYALFAFFSAPLSLFKLAAKCYAYARAF